MDPRAEIATPEVNVETPLTAACLTGKVDLVQSIINAKADVNEPNKRGEPPICMSSSKDYIEIARELLKAKADVNQANQFGGRPAILAAYQGKTDFLRWLVKEAKADVNMSDTEKGANALLLAAQENHTDNVELLLEAKANVNQPNNTNGATPLTITCQKGHTRIVELLLNAKADANQANAKKGVRPTTLAARKGHVSILQLLLDAKADVDEPQAKGDTPLQAAISKGKYETAQVLVAHSANTQASGKEAMALALGQKDLSLIYSLIQKDVQIDNIQALQDFLSTEKEQRDSRILTCLKKLCELKSLQAVQLLEGSEARVTMEKLIRDIDIYRRKLSCLHSSGRTFLFSAMNEKTPFPRALQDIVLEYVDGFFLRKISLGFLESSIVNSLLRMTKNAIGLENIAKPGFFNNTIKEIDEALELGNSEAEKSNSGPKLT
ncbi:MAG: ankyrin repeat domain-containing protein [Gammaproteobacteria bacterium]